MTAMDDFIFGRFQMLCAWSDIEQHLAGFLASGCDVWNDGELVFGRQLVGRIDGLKIEIFPNEHAPPHFHVHAPRIDASFRIEDGTLLQGTVRGKDRRLIEYWYVRAKPKLVEVWNSTRPSDCLVGPIVDGAAT